METTIEETLIRYMERVKADETKIKKLEETNSKLRAGIVMSLRFIHKLNEGDLYEEISKLTNVQL